MKQIQIPQCPDCGGAMRLNGLPKGKQRYECKSCPRNTVNPNFRTVTVESDDEHIMSLLELREQLTKVHGDKVIDLLLQYIHDPVVTEIVRNL
jgi:hypothetical protein